MPAEVREKDYVNRGTRGGKGAKAHKHDLTDLRSGNSEEGIRHTVALQEQPLGIAAYGLSVVALEDSPSVLRRDVDRGI